jgi:hypothetical protein
VPIRPTPARSQTFTPARAEQPAARVRGPTSSRSRQCRSYAENGLIGLIFAATRPITFVVKVANIKALGASAMAARSEARCSSGANRAVAAEG